MDRDARSRDGAESATPGTLTEIRPSSGRRAAVLAFPELLNIAEGRDVL